MASTFTITKTDSSQITGADDLDVTIQLPLLKEVLTYKIGSTAGSIPTNQVQSVAFAYDPNAPH